MKRLSIVIVTLSAVALLIVLSNNNVLSGLAQYGVYGKGEKHGVYGETVGDWGWASGVYGMASRDHAIGVTGWNSGGGQGLYGYSERGVAVMAKSRSGNLIEAWSTEPSQRRFRVDNTGKVYGTGSFRSSGADLAEMLPAVEGLEPGDVLVIGYDGKLTQNSEAYAANVVGVYSTNPGFVGGDGDDNDLAGKVPLAVLGVVPVKVTAENGPIRAGNMLVTSATPGHAMKASRNPSVGSVVGKALEGLDKGSGVIQMLVMLQ